MGDQSVILVKRGGSSVGAQEERPVFDGSMNNSSPPGTGVTIGRLGVVAHRWVRVVASVCGVSFTPSTFSWRCKYTYRKVQKSRIYSSIIFMKRTYLCNWGSGRETEHYQQSRVPLYPFPGPPQAAAKAAAVLTPQMTLPAFAYLVSTISSFAYGSFASV